jgi:hypothetical protein
LKYAKHAGRLHALSADHGRRPASNLSPGDLVVSNLSPRSQIHFPETSMSQIYYRRTPNGGPEAAVAVSEAHRRRLRPQAIPAFDDHRRRLDAEGVVGVVQRRVIEVRRTAAATTARRERAVRRAQSWSATTASTAALPVALSALRVSWPKVTAAVTRLKGLIIVVLHTYFFSPYRRRRTDRHVTPAVVVVVSTQAVPHQDVQYDVDVEPATVVLRSLVRVLAARLDASQELLRYLTSPVRTACLGARRRGGARG